MSEFGSLNRILSQTPEALGRIAGTGTGAANLILHARDMMIEAMLSDLNAVRIDPFDPNLRQYLIASMGSLPDEVLRIFFLDGAGGLIADEQLHQGTLGHLAIYPRTLFRRAMEHNAAGLILAHNHPSGDATPSKEDIRVTHRLAEIGQSLDIALVAHMVVTHAMALPICEKPSAPGQSGRCGSFTLKDEAARAACEDTARVLANAKRTMRRRILRSQLIGAPSLFGEPGWEMLLDVFIHDLEGKSLPMTSLCVTTGISMSSALRLVQKLVDANVLQRIPDPEDGRRSFIGLEASIAHRMRAYFAESDE